MPKQNYVVLEDIIVFLKEDIDCLGVPHAFLLSFWKNEYREWLVNYVCANKT